MGSPAAAQSLRESHFVRFPLLIAPDATLYRALALPRGGLWQLVGPESLAAAVRALLAGHRQGRTEADPRQLGGAFVVNAAGEVRHRRPARHAGDPIPWGWVERCLRSALRSNPSRPS